MKRIVLFIFIFAAFFLSAGEKYRIILLGDLHFDADARTYHSRCRDFNRRIKEFNRNAEMWRERMPKLLAAAAKLETADTKMIVQLGDLIQGDCDDAETHRVFLEDALKKVSGFFTRPVVVVTGNHDIRGEGAAPVCREVLARHNAEALGIPVRDSNYSFDCGGDTMEFVDLNSPDPAVFLQEKEGRFHFLFTHAPALPDDTLNTRWMLLGKNDEMRRRALDCFFRRDMLIFTGHTHRFVHHKWERNGETIDQIILSSVWAKKDLKELRVRFTNAADYGRIINSVKATEEAELASKIDQQELQAEYRPLLKEYFLAANAGFAALDVGDDGVVFTLYGGDDAEKPLKVIRLR
ncbi:MAG: metallophosphoesterase [Victivallaceae bacterium]|nr:metallophosphoesterase [Victivallaceae bacterium]